MNLKAEYTKGYLIHTIVKHKLTLIYCQFLFTTLLALKIFTNILSFSFFAIPDNMDKLA